jgi:adenylate cyclase
MMLAAQNATRRQANADPHLNDGVERLPSPAPRSHDRPVASVAPDPRAGLPPDAGSRPHLSNVLDDLSTAVAVIEPETWRVLYENTLFTDWFPPVSRSASPASGHPGDELHRRLPGLQPDRIATRLARGRSARWEAEIQKDSRQVGIEIVVRPATSGAGHHAIVEARDIARQKEAEYMLDSYSRLVERKTREIEQEKERAEKLLLNIMPRRVYEELKDFGTTTPQSFESVSVLMLDFTGFTEMAISREPSALIAELNDVFTSFDRIVEHFRGERIKTIGDAYMAVTGIPDADPDHPIHMARIALRMKRFLERRNANAPTQWRGRLGIGCGPAIGSIVGVQKYLYDIFGPAVNMASRLEQLADPMQILVCPETAKRIENEFIVRPLEEVDMKGFGRMPLFALEDEVRGAR